MRRKINPNQIVLGMMPRACDECKSIQHVFFTSHDEYNNWVCPECKGGDDGDNPELETES